LTLRPLLGARGVHGGDMDADALAVGRL